MYGFPFTQVLKAFQPDPTVGSGTLPPPECDSIDPVGGFNDSTTAVTITGTGFSNHGAAAVVFHRAGPIDFPATAEVVVDDLTITCTTAVMSDGVYDVIITFADGTTTTCLAAFTVITPG